MLLFSDERRLAFSREMFSEERLLYRTYVWYTLNSYIGKLLVREYFSHGEKRRSSGLGPLHAVLILYSSTVPKVAVYHFL